MTKDIDDNYDLAILHVVDAGPEYGRRVRLTRKAEAGEIGSDLVFEFDESWMIDDFVEQLRAVQRDAWGENEQGG